MSDTGETRRGWVKSGSHPIKMGYLECNKLYDFHFDNTYGYYYVECENKNISIVYLNHFEIIFLDDIRDKKLVDIFS